ncbi:MAG: hypothetical protein SYC29_00330 [Planctomycetota bacterium]|nr:hypothetical protein [Planctomycetota bacterium]
MAEAEATGEDRIVCHRCGALYVPGEPLFYVVKIEAYPLPELPPLTLEDLQRDFEEEMRRIVEETKGMSSREMMDQVYRRLVIYLCPRCYGRWIENPTAD